MTNARIEQPAATKNECWALLPRWWLIRSHAFFVGEEREAHRPGWAPRSSIEGSRQTQVARGAQLRVSHVPGTNDRQPTPRQTVFCFPWFHRSSPTHTHLGCGGWWVVLRRGASLGIQTGAPCRATSDCGASLPSSRPTPPTPRGPHPGRASQGVPRRRSAATAQRPAALRRRPSVRDSQDTRTL
jgi:hypothetical protein